MNKLQEWIDSLDKEESKFILDLTNERDELKDDVEDYKSKWKLTLDMAKQIKQKRDDVEEELQVYKELSEKENKELKEKIVQIVRVSMSNLEETTDLKQKLVKIDKWFIKNNNKGIGNKDWQELKEILEIKID